MSGDDRGIEEKDIFLFKTSKFLEGMKHIMAGQPTPM